MRLSTLGMAVLAAAALSGAAKAADLRDFEALCAATHAAAKPALAAADAAGWMPIPDALMAQMRRPGLETAQGRMKSDAGGIKFMLAAPGAALPNVPGFKLDVCAVGFAPADSTIADQVKTWVGVPEIAALSVGGGHGYAYVDNKGRHEGLAAQGMDPVTLFKTRNAAVVLVQDQPQVTLILLGVPSTTSPN